MFSRLRDIVLVPWRIPRRYRLFDERAGDLGPYYVSFGNDGNGERDPIASLQIGLEQHARWKRTGNERSRDLFLARAEWAAKAQREEAGVRGSGLAISLLLRAYQETGNRLFLDRAIDASVPLTVDLRDGGLRWEDRGDVILQVETGAVPRHMLSGWIYALWGVFELARTANLDHIDQLYRRSLATLEKYLPRYDSGTWSYEDQFGAPTGFRRVASLRRHRLHLAQLNVLLSMTGNEVFEAVAERWHHYAASPSGRCRAWVRGVLASTLS